MEKVLQFLEGNTETSKRLNELLKDEDISKKIDTIIGDKNSELYSMIQPFDKKDFVASVTSEMDLLIQSTKTLAILDCISSYFSLFLDTAGQKEISFIDTLDTLDLDKSILQALNTFIERVYIPKKISLFDAEFCDLIWNFIFNDTYKDDCTCHTDSSCNKCHNCTCNCNPDNGMDTHSFSNE